MNSTENISIWDGNPGNPSGSTALGIYDSDVAFQLQAPGLAKQIAFNLGYPIVAVELDSGSIYTAIEQASLEFSSIVNEYNIQDNLFLLKGAPTGSNLSGRNIADNFGRTYELAQKYGTEVGTGGDVTWKTTSIPISESVQNYNLDTLIGTNVEGGAAIEIKRIHHYRTPASQRFFNPLLGTQQLMNQFGFGNMGIGISYLMLPLNMDLLRMQTIEFNDTIRKSAYTFELINNQLRIFPIPEANYNLYIEYILKTDRFNPLKESAGKISDFSNVPYNNIAFQYITDPGKQWIRKYAIAIAKGMLGQVRSKYGSVPSANNEISMNGPDLISEAQQEKEQLIQQLRETLEKLTRRSQVEQRKEIAENLQEELAKIPLGYFIK